MHIKVNRIGRYIACVYLVGSGLTWSAAAHADYIVDVGSGRDGHLVGYGWGGAERNPDRDFRWIKELEADLTLPAREDAPDGYELQVEAAPYYVEGRRQNIGVFINNVFVGEWLCHDDPEFHVYSMKIPAALMNVPGEEHTLTLRMGYRQKPPGGDTRLLALAVDHVTLTPVTSESEQ